MRSRFLACAGAAAIAATTAGLARVHAQSPVRRIFNWIHGTGDAERAFGFYHDVFGIELARSPFAGAGATVSRTRTARDSARSSCARPTRRSVSSCRSSSTSGSDRAPNAWDPGASTLVIAVRDFDAVLGRLKARGAPIVTLGGAPVRTTSGRAIIVRDPDGCLIEVRQDGVLGTSIGITVANLAQARELYETLLGFTVIGTRSASATCGNRTSRNDQIWVEVLDRNADFVPRSSRRRETPFAGRGLSEVLRDLTA